MDEFRVNITAHFLSVFPYLDKQNQLPELPSNKRRLIANVHDAFRLCETRVEEITQKSSRSSILVHQARHNLNHKGSLIKIRMLKTIK